MDQISAPMTNLYKRSTATADLLRSILPEELKHPKIAIVCGSGLGGLAETIDSSPKVELPYEQVPGFPVSTGMYYHSPNI
jgi:purine-nucleoside phosphorylase